MSCQTHVNARKATLPLLLVIAYRLLLSLGYSGYCHSFHLCLSCPSCLPLVSLHSKHSFIFFFFPLKPDHYTLFLCPLRVHAIPLKICLSFLKTSSATSSRKREESQLKYDFTLNDVHTGFVSCFLLLRTCKEKQRSEPVAEKVDPHTRLECHVLVAARPKHHYAIRHES